MALSVRGLAGQPDLGVRVLAEAAADDQPITWVHVSELDDPTPFLSGGELLLTTGLFVRPGTDFDDYVEKLRGAGVLGLGVGVGLSLETVPPALVSAAERHGLALLEVPRRTPFIALSRAVSRALAADEYAAVTRTFTAQQELTRAALAADSPARLIRLLARKVDGWVVLLDGRGGVVALGGERAAVMVPAVAVEAARLREHRGSVGASFEVDTDTGTDAVSLQPVGAGLRRRAFLAVGRPGPLPPADRHLVNAAVMLLTLGLEQNSASDAAGAVPAVRSAAVELALDGHLDLARSIAARIGAPWPDDPLVVLLALPARGSGVVGGDCAAGPADDAVWSAELDGELVVVAPADAAEALAADLAGTGPTVGRSAPTTGEGLTQARVQARRAAAVAVDRGLPTLAFDAIGAAGITGLWDPEQAAAFAESLLAPLIEHDRTGRGDLLASLRGWLTHHGQWDPAAGALGVHRHTLRRRMALAADLLGRDLDSPTVRSELWLASEVLAHQPITAR